MPPKQGPSSTLVRRIDHLKELLKHLPKSLPEKPQESTYHFGVNVEEVKRSDEGYWYFFSQNLEVCFQTHLLRDEPLLFKERGERLDGLIKFLKESMKWLSAADQELFRDSWLERLIQAAEASGAKIPPRKRPPPSDSEDNAQQPAVATALRKKAADRSRAKASESSRKSTTGKKRPLQTPGRTKTAPLAEIDLTLSDSDSPAGNIATAQGTESIDLTQSNSGASCQSSGNTGEATKPTPSSLFVTMMERARAAGGGTSAASKNHRSNPASSQKRAGSPDSSTDDSDDPTLRAVKKAAAKPQTTLLHWGYGKKLSPDEAAAQKARQKEKEEAEAAERAKRAEEQRLRDERAAARAAQLKRDGNRERQRKCRARRYLREMNTGIRNSSGKKVKAAILGHDKASSRTIEDRAELSRPGKTAWKSKRNGKHGGAVQQKHVRMNWYHPYLWSMIDAIAPRVDWSPQQIVLHLQRQSPEVFKNLNRSTVFKWLSKSKKRKGWSKRTLANVERRAALARSGRTGILTLYPALVDLVKKQLTDLRLSGVRVNLLVVRALMLATIREKNPELLTNFTCSENYVRQFLSSVMKWSIRRGTRAAAHIPEDAPELCEAALYRIVHLLFWYDIPVKLLINMDQTGVLLVPGDNLTYHNTGDKQISIIAKDEKRAYTLVVASSCDGDILPFQQVWSGATTRSCPSADAPGMKEALERGFHFTVADSPKRTSHFSTLKTMKEWMERIYEPYVAKIVEQDGLPADQKSILLLDCYPVHTSEEFRSYVRSRHPNVFLVYVPANCTGIFQPADVGLQRVIKHHLKQDSLDFLVREHAKMVKQGIQPADIKFAHGLPALRDASVQGIVDVWDFLKDEARHGPDIVRKAWDKCTVKDKNLSRDTLTDTKMKASLREYLITHSDLRNEIESKIGPLPLATEPDAADMDDLEDEDAELDKYHSSEVPLTAVIEHELHVRLDHLDQDSTGVTVGVARAEDVVESHGSLRAERMEENIDSYRDDGMPWDDYFRTAQMYML